MLSRTNVYRPALDNSEALRKMRTPEGHLAGELLAEFENAVMQRFRTKKV